MLSSTNNWLPLRFETVKDGGYGELIEMMKQEERDYIELATALEQITWQEFEELFSKIGEVRTIYLGQENAGFFWIEERGRVLHLHGLILKPEFQKRGIGGEVLRRLAQSYRNELDVIQSGVHETNQKGLIFFIKEGFFKLDNESDHGFIILQKPLGGMEREDFGI